MNSFDINPEEFREKVLISDEIVLWIPRSWFTKNTSVIGGRRFFSRNFVGVRGECI